MASRQVSSAVALVGFAVLAMLPKNIWAADKGVVFLHIGDRDPKAEGWKFSTGKNGKEDPKPVVPDEGIYAGKVAGDLPAWQVTQGVGKGKDMKFGLGYYRKLEPKETAEVEERGWTLDAIVRSKGVGNGKENTGSALIYATDKKKWVINLGADKEGNAVIGLDNDPNSIFRLKDANYHHIRIVCEPKGTDATIFIDGLRVKAKWVGVSEDVAPVYKNRMIFGSTAKTEGVGQCDFALVLFAAR